MSAFALSAPKLSTKRSIYTATSGHTPRRNLSAVKSAIECLQDSKFLHPLISQLRKRYAILTSHCLGSFG